jgi:hypothetical protein
MPRDRFYILRVDSYTGHDTSRDQHEILDEEGWNVQEISALYAVVRIDEDGASIADDGYRSIAEAQKAWPKAFPSNATHGNSHATRKRRKK